MQNQNEHFLKYNTNFRYMTVVKVLENYQEMYKRGSLSVKLCNDETLLKKDPTTKYIFWNFPILFEKRFSGKAFNQQLLGIAMIAIS